MSVTEDAPGPDGVSVTSPGALDKSQPPARCHECGVHLTRKFTFGSYRSQINYRKGARYCTPACRQKAYRRRDRGRP